VAAVLDDGRADPPDAVAGQLTLERRHERGGRAGRRRRLAGHRRPGPERWNPTSLLGGTLAVGVCAYLAAVYLTADAARARQPGLAEALRRRALVTGLVVGAIALAGIAVLRADAPVLFDGLTGRALPLIAASALSGLASLWLLLRRRFLAVRVTAALAVAAVVWGWAAGQYPWMLLGGLTIEQAAASRPVIEAVLGSLAVGAVLFLPPLVWLFVLFQRTQRRG